MGGVAHQHAFVDEVDIGVSGGNGGDGIISFLRQRARPYGGPNGGDGGRGGNVFASAFSSVNTLLEFRYRRRVAAKNGQRGMGKDCHGRNGTDVYLKVPLGTRITDAETGCLHADLTIDEETVLLAAGGVGGIGNARFKSSTNRSPRIATPGKKGDNRSFHLELTVLASIGLLGLPNAGKSTFLNAISAARARTADYPFTTIEPQLGAVSLPDSDSSVIVADIPGLIRGAAQGAGLGNRFLRHLSRTTLLCQIVDATSSSLPEDCHVISEELRLAKDRQLIEKPRWLVMNKIDCLSTLERKKKQEEIAARFPHHFERTLLLSAKTGEGIGTAVAAMIERYAQTLS